MNIIFFTLKAFSYENGNILTYEQLLFKNSKFINNCLFNEVIKLIKNENMNSICQVFIGLLII
jgi:hypothetical protein